MPPLPSPPAKKRALKERRRWCPFATCCCCYCISFFLERVVVLTFGIVAVGRRRRKSIFGLYGVLFLPSPSSSSSRLPTRLKRINKSGFASVKRASTAAGDISSRAFNSAACRRRRQRRRRRRRRPLKTKREGRETCQNFISGPIFFLFFLDLARGRQRSDFSPTTAAAAIATAAATPRLIPGKERRKKSTLQCY